MIILHCERCERPIGGRNFRRRSEVGRIFCSPVCLQRFETETGLPKARIDESRPGWSSFPLVDSRQGMPLS